MNKIQMVDLKGQYTKIKEEVLGSINEVLDDSAFIQGKQVKLFEEALSSYVNSKFCISCANGTDALQIAMMALDLKPGDEIIIPAFTYIATAETAALLGLKLVLAEVDPYTFNIDVHKLEKLINAHTKAIVPVHLYGQCSDMEGIINLAKKYNLYIIEDNAQAIGADFLFSDGKKKKAGTIGTIGTTSFFPSKNLGCYGDGGALFTDDENLAKKMKAIANHGQDKKYYHDVIGINSRLDTLQAAILNVKLNHLNMYIEERQKVAALYNKLLTGNNNFSIPVLNPKSTHVFHQYTLKLHNADRADFKKYLEDHRIPSMIYYPEPIHFQKAYQYLGYKSGDFPVSENLAKNVISLPIHTEIELEQISYIAEHVVNYFNK
jgi:UDP-2-acetamido-2-deoxy-ribo-hexuluronate aminotransferase